MALRIFFGVIFTLASLMWFSYVVRLIVQPDWTPDRFSIGLACFVSAIWMLEALVRVVNDDRI